MANKGPSTPARTISEVDAHLLLARAAELDARLGARVSTDTLWRSAREAGISVEALAQATAELDSGALAAPSRSRAIAVSAVLLTRVGIAGTIVIALIVNPKYPFAQGMGLALGVYGAYDVLGRLSRWLGKRSSAIRERRADQSRRAESSPDENAVLAVRLLPLQTPSPDAA